MKIAFIVSYIEIGGVGRVFINTLDALSKYTNCDITVCLHSMPTDKFYTDWFRHHPDINVRIYYKQSRIFENLHKYARCFPLKQIRKICFSLYKRWCDFRMAQWIDRNNFDAVIDYVSGESYKQLKFIKNTNKITWVHCSAEYVQDQGLMARLAKYKTIVCISNGGKQKLSALYPQYADRFVQIYNPVDLHYIQENSKNMPKYVGKYFVCVGRLDKDKDTATIISAFNDFWINNGRPDVKMVFVGDGVQRKYMAAMADKTPAKNQFVFLGTILNAYGYVQGAMAHILSSYSEGLSLVLIESMAAKTVNIASDCPDGPREVLLNGNAGILFAPGNVNELSAALSRVWNKEINIQAMISNATRSLTRFNQKNVAMQIYDLITANLGK